MGKLNKADVDKLGLQQAVEGREKLFRETIEPMKTEFHESGDAWKDETRANAWSDANDDFDLLGQRITNLRNASEVTKRFESANEIMAEISNGQIDRRTGEPRPVPGSDDIKPEDRAIAFQGWCRYQMEGDVSRRQREAMKKVKLSGSRKKLVGRLMNSTDWKQVRRLVLSGQVEKAEQRALSATTATSGAEFIPEGFVSNLEIAMLDYSGVLQVADILRTTSGNEMPWPTMNDTGNKGALVAENTAVGTSTDPATSSVVFNAYKYTSNAVLVPFELLEDEDIAPELPNILLAALAERCGRILEEHFTTGTGSSQPNGIVTASTLGKTAASATAITFSELIELEHSVDPAYRKQPSAGYMMNDGIVKAMRLINDSDGKPLWQEGSVQNGQPARLNNYPVTINQEMQATVATATKTVLFGALAKYKVRMVNRMRLYRLEERYRDSDQDGFVAFIRADGDLLDAGTNPVKHLLQA